MDGFEKKPNVFVIAATNFPSDLDPALLRSGRMDKIIKISKPTITGRRKLLDYYLEGKKLEKMDIDRLAKITMDFTGSDIKCLVNLA